MYTGVRTIIYPVKELQKARALFINILGSEPYIESPQYIGFRIGDQEIGLDPIGHRYGMTAYFKVDDIYKIKQSLLNNGATIIQDVKNVGGGRSIAALKDPDGNIIGLIQDSSPSQ
jgi:predicted enzyme related to lactoylglutathione lyase